MGEFCDYFRTGHELAKDFEIFTVELNWDNRNCGFVKDYPKSLKELNESFCYEIKVDREDDSSLSAVCYCSYLVKGSVRSKGMEQSEICRRLNALLQSG